MNIFFILVGISFVGILAVFWLLRNEDKPSLRNFGVPPAATKPPATPRAKKPSLWAGFFIKFNKNKKEAIAEVPLSNVTDFIEKSSLGAPIPAEKSSATFRVKNPSLLAGLFAKLKKGKKISREEAITQVPLPSVTDFIEKSFVVYQDTPEAVPAAPQVALSAAEEKKIEQEIDLVARIEEWKGKYERLDKLFNEKSAALTKSEESLQTELSNRKEFNKLKDMLEKELREAKDKARSVQVELNAARTEAEGSKKRIAQLEEKITKMEKAILGKDDEIVDLAKRLQAAASIPPVAAPVTPDVSPPTVEAPQQPAPEETPLASSPHMSGSEQGKGEGEQAQGKEEGFLKLQPDILAPANPSVAPVEPETKGNGPNQSPYPAPPEVNSQDTQSKSVSEGQTDQQDEQKKE